MTSDKDSDSLFGQADQEWSERRARQMQFATEVAQEIAAASSRDALYRRVVTLVKERLGYTHAQIFVYDPELDVMRVVAGYGQAGEEAKGAGYHVPYGQGIVGVAAAAGEPVLAPDVSDDPDWVGQPGLPATRGELAVPIILRRSQEGDSRDQVLGVLDVQSDEPQRLTEEDQMVLLGLAGQIAVAIENARLLEEQQRARLLLDKRVKELAVLNEIGRKMEENPSVPEFLQWVAARIPPAMQYPDVCVAAIEFEGQVYGQAEATNLPCQTVGGLWVRRETWPSLQAEPAAEGSAEVLVGRVYIAYTEEHEFIDEESALLGDIARRVGNYLESRTLIEQTQSALAETRALYHFSDVVSREVNLEAVYNSVARSLVEELGYTAAWIATLRQEGDEGGGGRALQVVASAGELTLDPGRMLSLSEVGDPAVLAVLERKPVVINDPLHDERVGGGTLTPTLSLAGRGGGPSTTLMAGPVSKLVEVPIFVGGSVNGVIAATRALHEADIGEREVWLLQAVATQTTIAIQRAQLFEQTRAALAQTRELYHGSEMINTAVTFEELLSALRQSTALDQSEWVSIALFDHPWIGGDRPMSFRHVAVWERGRFVPAAQPRTPLEEIPLLAYLRRDELFGSDDVAGDKRLTDEVKVWTLEKVQGGPQATMLGAPLTIGEEWIGIVTGLGRRPFEVTEQEKRQLITLAAQAAVALRSQQNLQRTQEALAQTEVLYRANRRLTQATTMGEVADAAIASVAETGADGCLVAVFDFSPEGEPEVLSYIGVWRRDREPQFTAGMRLPIAESPFPLEMVSTLWTVPDVTQADWLPQSAARVYGATGVAAVANIPLRTKERVIGQVVVLRSEAGPFSGNAMQLYEMLSDQAAVALERARLLEQAQRRAARERLIGQITDQMQRATDMEDLMRITAEGLNSMLGGSRTFVRMGTVGDLTGDQ